MYINVYGVQYCKNHTNSSFVLGTKHCSFSCFIDCMVWEVLLSRLSALEAEVLKLRGFGPAHHVAFMQVWFKWCSSKLDGWRAFCGRNNASIHVTRIFAWLLPRRICCKAWNPKGILLLDLEPRWCWVELPWAGETCSRILRPFPELSESPRRGSLGAKLWKEGNLWVSHLWFYECKFPWCEESSLIMAAD